MECLRRIYRCLDTSGEPSYSKTLFRYIFRKTSAGGEVRTTKHLFKHGADFNPLRRQELIEQNGDGVVIPTDKAWAMIH